MPEMTGMCPFLVRVMADRLWVVRTTGYCRATDRVRVPGLKTIANRCLDAYGSCPGYRARMAEPQSGSGPALH